MNNILAQFRFCWICKRYSGVRFFCKACENLYDDEIGADWAEVEGLPVISYLRWTTRSAPWIRPLLYNLKEASFKNSTHLSLARNLLSDIYWNNDSLHLKGLQKLLVVPPTTRESNHALSWAGALLESWEGEVVDPFLTAPSDGRQKALRRKERARKTFKLKEKMTISQANKTVIMADDLITTGYTAAAAFKALGSPSAFCSICIARRPRLASNIKGW